MINDKKVSDSWFSDKEIILAKSCPYLGQSIVDGV